MVFIVILPLHRQTVLCEKLQILLKYLGMVTLRQYRRQRIKHQPDFNNERQKLSRHHTVNRPRHLIVVNGLFGIFAVIFWTVGFTLNAGQLIPIEFPFKARE